MRDLNCWDVREAMDGPTRPRFQLRLGDLLGAMALLGVSLGMASLSWRSEDSRAALAWWIGLGLHLGSAAALGAAIGCFYRRPLLGAVWGLGLGLTPVGLAVWAF